MTVTPSLLQGPPRAASRPPALALAEEIGGVVINANSMQVYREAPDPDGAASRCRQGARAASALRPCQRARGLFRRPLARRRGRRRWREARAMQRVPIFVGGTGLYFMALTEGLADIPPTPPEIRDAARALLDDIGVEALHAKLTERDPLTARKLRPSDPQRVLRAFEVFEATGRPLAEWQKRARRAAAERRKHRRLCAGPAAPRTARPHRRPRSRPCWMQGGLEEARGAGRPGPRAAGRQAAGPAPASGPGGGNPDPGRGAGRRHHRHAAICQAPDDVVSPPDATLYLV